MQTVVSVYWPLIYLCQHFRQWETSSARTVGCAAGYICKPRGGQTLNRAQIARQIGIILGGMLLLYFASVGPVCVLLNAMQIPRRSRNERAKEYRRSTFR